MQGLAYRRAQFERIKTKRKQYWGTDRVLTERQMGMAAHTAAICSCWMCGNPRKYEGERSVQERRAMQLPE